MYAWNQFSPTCQAVIRKDSSDIDTSLPLSAITYLIMHAQYLALINLTLKLKFCAKVSSSLLLILLAFHC